MKILFIPSWFPNVQNPIWGNYLVKQALEMSNYADVYMLNINRIGLKERLIGYKAYQKDGFDNQRFGFCFFQASILNLRTLNVKLSFWLYAISSYLAFKKFEKIIGKPDIIVAQSILPAALAARYISKKTKIPYVLHEHSVNVLNRWGRHVPGLLKDSSGVFTVSEMVKKKLAEFSDEKIEIIPNFIDVKSFDIERKKHDTFNLICIANFYKVKAIEILIEAVSILVNDSGLKNIRLNIVGTGEYENYYKQAANDLKTGDYVNFCGYLNKEEILEYMKISDLLCVSSRNETFAIPIIEAFASGIPVISTRCGGPEEIISDETGVLVQVDNPNEYAQGVLKIYNNYDKYDAKKLKRIVFDKYDKSVVCEKFVKELTKVIEKSN